MSTSICEPVIGPKYKTAAWYSLRNYDKDLTERPIVFGASDAASICNLNPYCSPLEFYLRATGQYEDERTEEEETRLDIGLRLEPVILDLYELREGVEVERNLPMYLSAEVPFMGASLDGRVNKENDKRVVDSKSSNFRMFDESGDDDNKFGKEGTDQIPLYMLFQAQHQMAVMGVERADFPVLVDASGFKIYTVLRNNDLISQIISSEQEMFERIVNGDPPEPTWSHDGTRRLLGEMFGYEAGQVTELTLEDKALWEECQDLTLQKKDLDERINAIKNELLFKLGDNELGRFPGSNIELKRTIVKDSIVTQDKVDKLAAKIGKVDRKGHQRLGCRKIKK